jgi:hypothetical protein
MLKLYYILVSVVHSQHRLPSIQMASRNRILKTLVAFFTCKDVCLQDPGFGMDETLKQAHVCLYSILVSSLKEHDHGDTRREQAER